MENKDKQRLLKKDLYARLPYGVKLQRDNVFDASKKEVEVLSINFLYENERYNTFETLNIKPFLRPMSSMTEEEKELMKGSVICFNELEGNSTLFDVIGLDWLNAHYFDYRGLISLGLAIEAPENMYK